MITFFPVKNISSPTIVEFSWETNHEAEKCVISKEDITQFYFYSELRKVLGIMLHRLRVK